MKWLSDWFHSHNVSTHVIASVIGIVAVLVETDRHVRDLLLVDLGIHPKIISSLACLGAILLAYKQPKKLNGAPPTEPEPGKDKAA